MNSSDPISHIHLGFDNQKYFDLQKEAILERTSHFSNGTLYLEIGGKFLFDAHAQRVLPGFDPKIKPRIIRGLNIPYEIIFCVNAQDISGNRMLTNKNENYIAATLALIKEYQKELPVQLTVAINLVREITPEILAFQETLTHMEIKSFIRYAIKGYPDPKTTVSDIGYAKDEYFQTQSPLVLVSGPASNSGKMSTCLGQIYHDEKHQKDSGYAKYELFPIWNLPLKHPVNLAYEAATADISDYNLYDPHHKQAYGADVVNYNRDVEAFPIITGLLKEIIPQTNYMQHYRSPTDMGMNKAGFAITNDKVVSDAAIQEIQRRRDWFKQQVIERRGKMSWVEKCEELEKEAETYVQGEKS